MNDKLPSPSSSEIIFLKTAADFLENPSRLVKLTDQIGKPLKLGLELLPTSARNMISSATEKALEKALVLSINTIPAQGDGNFDRGLQKNIWTRWKHTGLSAASGAVGGFFGFMSLPLELPLTTGIMLRSIASIADEFGHDLQDVGTRLECLAVFSMGSPASGDDQIDSAYFTTRTAISRVIEETMQFIAKKTAKEISSAVATKSAPILVRFVAQVAARFEIVISEKVMAEVIPGIGAVAGAAVNAAFTDHFNTIAKYHFGIRALETKYGESAIKEIYESYKAEKAKPV